MNSQTHTPHERQITTDMDAAKADELSQLASSACCNCSEFQDAQKKYTDNEGWDPLIYEWDNGWGIGSDLPPMNYCPWCGKSVPPNP